MKTKTITLFEFYELSETAKKKAIENLADINVDHSWWEFTYQDAEDIGLKIDGFDLDRNRHATGKLTESGLDVARLIKKNHGENCETFKTAQQFLADWDNLVAKYSDGKNLEIVSEDNEAQFDEEANELEAEFCKSLLEDYSIILQNEYEHLTSEAAIIETIEANGYTFTESGKLEN